MIKVIKHYLKHWMRGSTPDYTHQLLPGIPIHSSLLTNIQDQTKIGWDHFLRGKTAKSWTDTQNLHKPGTNTKFWKKKLVTNLINTSNCIWEKRNSLNFGSTETKLIKMQKKLEPYIIKLYSLYKNTTQHPHHHLFHTPLQLRIKFSPQENKQWISTVKIAQRIHKKKQKQFYKNHTKITKYVITKKRKTPTRDSGEKNQTNTGTNKLRKTTQTNICTFLIHRDPPNDAPT